MSQQNNPYYQPPYNPYMSQPAQQVFPQQIQQVPSMQSTPPQQVAPMPSPSLAPEQSYIENILRLNRGKIATVYMTFENNNEWNAKIFKGIIEAAGRDHVILSDPQTGMRFLLPVINLDYVTFDEEIELSHPYNNINSGLGTYFPR